METINYTVIIPNKNQPLLLQRCIKSIPERKDIQIIIVDDNSDPNIIDFKNYPGNTRENVEIVYTKEGKGAGYARNIGLKRAQGKWLLFADSDDFYHEKAFEVLDKYVNKNLDILYFNVDSVDTNTLRKGYRDHNYSKYINLYITGKEPNGDSIRFRKWEPWNKMLRKDFVIKNNLLSDEIPRCNDMIFSLLSSYKAISFDIINEVIYCVTYNPLSITRKKITPEVYKYCFLCDIKRNIIYDALGLKKWKSHHILNTLYLLKNNGIIGTIQCYRTLINDAHNIQSQKINFKKVLSINE